MKRPTEVIRQAVSRRIRLRRGRAGKRRVIAPLLARKNSRARNLLPSGSLRARASRLVEDRGRVLAVFRIFHLLKRLCHKSLMGVWITSYGQAWLMPVAPGRFGRDLRQF